MYTGTVEHLSQTTEAVHMALPAHAAMGRDDGKSQIGTRARNIDLHQTVQGLVHNYGGLLGTIVHVFNDHTLTMKYSDALDARNIRR